MRDLYILPSRYRMTHRLPSSPCLPDLSMVRADSPLDSILSLERNRQSNKVKPKRTTLSRSTSIRIVIVMAFGFAIVVVTYGVFFIFNSPTNNPSTLFRNIDLTQSHFSIVFSRFFPNISTASSQQGSEVFSMQYSDLRGGGFNGSILSENPKSSVENVMLSPLRNWTYLIKDVKMSEAALNELQQCDFFDGQWIKDHSYPLYPPGICPHIDEPFDCYHNGRFEPGYESFKWKPKGCNIPRFDGEMMLEILRGKRLIYVGDSLNQNMWESMVCLLRNSIKDKIRKNFLKLLARRSFD